MLRLYDANNVVLGSVECDDSVWLLKDGVLRNKFSIRLSITQPGKPSRMRLGNWLINTAVNVSGLDSHLLKDSVVIFAPGNIVIEMTIRDQEKRHDALGDLGS